MGVLKFFLLRYLLSAWPNLIILQLLQICLRDDLIHTIGVINPLSQTTLKSARVKKPQVSTELKQWDALERKF